MLFTITFTDDTPTRSVDAGSYGFGNGQLEFFTDAIPVGDPIATVRIIDGEGSSILADVSTSNG